MREWPDGQFQTESMPFPARNACRSAGFGLSPPKKAFKWAFRRSEPPKGRFDGLHAGSPRGNGRKLAPFEQQRQSFGRFSTTFSTGVENSLLAKRGS
jgi:hypothetical protein